MQSGRIMKKEARSQAALSNSIREGMTIQSIDIEGCLLNSPGQLVKNAKKY